MIRRTESLSLAASGLALAALLTVCFWLTSLDFGEFQPGSPAITFLLWTLSTFVVVGTIALGFLLFRNLVKLYIERRQNKPGSHIRWKLAAGVLAVSVAPIALHVYFSVTLLNRNMDKWFSQPTVNVLKSAEDIVDQTNAQLADSMQAEASRLAVSLGAIAAADERRLGEALRRSGADFVAAASWASEEIAAEALGDGAAPPRSLRQLGRGPLSPRPQGVSDGWIYAAAALPDGSGSVLVARAIPVTVLEQQRFIEAQVREWQELEGERPVVWRTHAYILALITIFMLFVAVWLAHFASKLITRPIEALVTATGELAGGHLGYRVETPATDELAGLVASFNRMVQALEDKTRLLQLSNLDLASANAESEERRRFIDAILQSIKPAVVSVNDSGEILKYNESARQMAAGRPVASLQDFAEILAEPDRTAFHHMFSTARRTGMATREFEVEDRGLPRHLSLTVSSLDTEEDHHSFVVVFEDTTEIMRAQRSEAWQEVARRLAHEIKNPLTPVALAAGRIDRLLERLDTAGDPQEREAISRRLLRSTRTIDREVQSLKSLVDSFSDLARFPAIRPEETDLNAVVRDAVSVFDGRLPGVRLIVDADPGLPPVRIDPQPFKRVIVNLIDNAAEVVQQCWVKEIVVSTHGPDGGDFVELAVADSGPGISPEDRRKLFLPYFSTKERGTGLGLSIVRRVVDDHAGRIRVEDNHPTGSRFIIEVPVAAGSTAALREAVA